MENEELFKKVGLDAGKAKETCKNKKLSEAFARVIKKVDASGNVEKSVGLLLYQVATRISHDFPHHEDVAVEYVANKKLKTSTQIEAAIDYFKKNYTVDRPAFEEATGVGVEITPAQIKDFINKLIEENKAKLIEDRYLFNIPGLFASAREGLKWADGKLLKTFFDDQILSILGPKNAEDEAKAARKKEKKPEAAKKVPEAVASTSTEGEQKVRIFEGEVLRLHKPGENPQIKPELMEQHLKTTGGKVITRFPPEPNGFLHIGHGKAMNFNFRYAEANNGICYLRLDDTNPEAEEIQYYESIQRMVEWMGFKPFKVTNTSDYFHQLHELAVKIIKRGKAYVCHMTPKEMQQSRGGEDGSGVRFDSPWRNRPIEENLKIFEDMKKGKLKEGEATLRLKIDMQSGNPYMWDPVAYRIMYWPHVKTGNEWCIYPTYDFSHCLCDSIENITHSFCTVEFTAAREAYYWVCDAAEVYKPVQWEYGRLNITNTVMSKRKLMRLVKEGFVNGWDDPRLYTIEALKRRGFTNRAINNFAEKLGITTSLTTVNVELLEACVRDDLNLNAPRAKAILDPIKVTITNYPEDKIEDIIVYKFPNDPSKGEVKVPFSKVIYIDGSDFKEVDDDPTFKRLVNGKEVGLLRAYNITCNEIIKDSNGKVVEIKATYDPENSRKQKGYIQWVAHCPSRNSPVKAEIRLYSSLFLSKNPEDHPDGFLSDINPNSLKVIPNALADVSVLSSKPFDHFQFERVGYFCVDKESTPKHFIFNLTVSLKEDPKKAS